MRRVICIQGWYYLCTGLWPIIHLDSFIWATGPKHDVWMVKMIALLSICVGISLLARGSILLASTIALSFAAIDVIYVLDRTIPKTYLFDAVLQLVFIAWILLSTRIRIARLQEKNG